MTDVEVRRSGVIAWLQAGSNAITTVPYGSPHAAWAAYEAWNAANQPYPPAEFRVKNFRPCPNASRYFWGLANSWCHDWERYYNGNLTDSGVTSVVSAGNVCPDYFTTTNTSPLNGVGNYPEYYEHRCERSRTSTHPDSCPAIGNPIHPTTGAKRQIEVDYVDPGGVLTLLRAYDSGRGGFRHSFQKDFLIPVAGVQGGGDAFFLSIYNNTFNRFEFLPVDAPRLNVTGSVATLFDESGVWYSFDWNGAGGLPRGAFNKDQLASRGGAAGYWIRQSSDSRFILLNQAGSLDGIVWSDGRTAQIQYSTGPVADTAPDSGYLTSVSDRSGRTLSFSYESDGRLKKIHLPDGSAIHYQHEDGWAAASRAPLARARKPNTVTYPDGGTIQYLWNESAYVTGNPTVSDALTGIVDQTGTRFATFRYRNGKAVGTEHTGGTASFTISDSRYIGSGAISVTDPLGSVRSLNYAVNGGFSRLVGTTQPAGSGCAASSRSISYDANGNKASEDDFNGKRVCYGSDLSRNLERVRVEGLSAGANCGSYTAAGASLPAGARKASTAWHTDWRMKIKVAEPGRITTKVYNGQPDPYASGAAASCAPADALLPDGKPIAVLCRQVEQATTDANGSQGFDATPQSGVANREERWTYDRWGQVLTHDGPRTDVNDVTTYAYYSDTSFTGSGADAVGHTEGDLQSVTNAAGQITQYTKYNKHGQLLESIGPNGVVTVRTYDLRQRLRSVTEAGQITTYTYDAAGQLTRITWPDASYIGHEYDPAHRQTAVFDNIGNRIEYTLDNAGNRIGENVKDPGGLLSRQLSRSVDALGRVQQTTGRE